MLGDSVSPKYEGRGVCLWPPNSRPSLFPDTTSEPTPAELWDRDSAKRTLDELFSLTSRYRSSQSYHQLMEFVGRFRWYSPFNAMLVHVQLPGAVFVAPANRWLRDYGHTIKSGARPLVILQPMGPVMFVFDVSDTEGQPLPREVEKPFETSKGRAGPRLPRTIENSKRDGVAVHTARLGSQQAASIRVAPTGKTVLFAHKRLRVGCQIELSQNANEESRYASLVHEMAHLYCGHLGSPNPKWWPDRRGLSVAGEELEAESVSYLVCTRAGIKTPSEQYLANYVSENAEVHGVSLDCVMKAAGLVETMGAENLKPRKEK